MNKFNFRDCPVIEPGSPVWAVVKDFSEQRLSELRKSRERSGADLRELDAALGAIHFIEELLKLPEHIRRERQRDPVKESDPFGIPAP